MDAQTAGVFYGQLSGLLKAGMPMPQALRTLAVESASARFREAMERVAAATENGASPEEAFKAEEKALGAMLGRVTASAASTGKLPALLSELSAWTLLQDRLRRQIVDVLTYPFTVLILASALALAFTIYANRSMAFFDMFKELNLNDEYMQYTRMMIAVAIIIGVIFGFSLLLPMLYFLSRVSAFIRRIYERLLIYLPVAGSICRPLALSRFCGSVAILMKAGVAYHEAVAAAGALSGFEPYARAAEEAAQRLQAGVRQAAAWANSRLFPPSFHFILASAEARGDVPEAFAELAELYRVEAEARGRVVAVLAPPACLVAVGVVVGLMLYGSLGPLSELMSIMIQIGR